MPITQVQQEKLDALILRRDKYFARMQAVYDLAKALTKDNFALFKARYQGVYKDFDSTID